MGVTMGEGVGVSLQELTTLFYLFNFFEIGSY